MDLFLVYLWLKLDSVLGVFQFITVVGLCSLLVLTYIYLLSFTESDIRGTEARIKLKKCINKALLIISISTTFAIVIPSTKDMAILIGVHYINKAIETPEAAKIQTLLRMKANEVLDKHIQEGAGQDKKK